jgi:hypothetical protein
MGTVSEIQHWKQVKPIHELAKQHGEAIDNLPTDVLLEAIYNEKKILENPLNSK